MINNSKKEIVEMTYYFGATLVVSIISAGFQWQYVFSMVLLYVLCVISPIACLRWSRKAKKIISMYLDVINFEKNPFSHIKYHDLIESDQEVRKLIEDGSYGILMSDFSSYLLAKTLCDLFRESHLIDDNMIEVCVVKGKSFASSGDEKKTTNPTMRYFVAAYAKRDHYKINPIIIDPIGEICNINMEKIAECAKRMNGVSCIIPNRKFSMYEIYIRSDHFTIGYDNARVKVITEDNVKIETKKVSENVRDIADQIWGGILW